ncbi:hypothetical protein J6R97_06620 [bacterium]|nr:hypothetical protein [bacterium]
MASRIVLVSDDSDFFDYIRAKLELRKSDELFMFSFDMIPEKVHLIDTAVLIVNSENSREKTLDLLNLFKCTPIIVSAFNDDDSFRRKCYRSGMFDFITLLTPDAEFRSRMIPALAISGLLEKDKMYKEILIKNNILSSENDVFIDYEFILDKELQSINNGVKKAVFGALSPNEKDKYLLKPALLESILLNNIRQNDILMNFAANKYFVLLFDIDLKSAHKLWDKISSQLPVKVYAGFCTISNQKRQQLINEALNKLHEAINVDRDIVHNSTQLNGLSIIQGEKSSYINFKMFRHEFGRKIEQIITPVFYQMQQKYSGSFSGVTLEHGSGEGYGTFYIKSKNVVSCFRITSPGFSKINIDITYEKDKVVVDSKRITLEPEELESGLLEDLLEQFILEYKRGCGYDS